MIADRIGPVLQALLGICMIALLVQVSLSDFKNRIISNRVITLMLVLGLLQIALLLLWSRDVWSLVAGLLLGLPFLPVWIQGKIGAGDVKLISISGIFLGLPSGLLMLVLTLILLLIIAAILIFRKQIIHERLPLGPIISASTIVLITVKLLFMIVNP